MVFFFLYLDPGKLKWNLYPKDGGLLKKYLVVVSQIFLCSPLLGEVIQLDEHIFQMG